MTAIQHGNPWTAGSFSGRKARLLFGRMHEDPAIELDALGHCTTILAIASAGDTARVLAGAGHTVTAIDINPAQVAYVGRRLAGEPARAGQADRLMAAGRRLLGPAGWTSGRLERLCRSADCDAQVAQWRRLTSGFSGAALRTVLAPSALRFAYQPAFARQAAGLRTELPRRIEQGLATHPNRDNPWARLLFTGRWPDREPPTTPFELRTGDVTAHLEAVTPGSYDGFTLSNVLDGTPEHFRRRLVAALKRAAAPDATVVIRTLGAARTVEEATAARRDRALIWGAITICSVAELS